MNNAPVNPPAEYRSQVAPPAVNNVPVNPPAEDRSQVTPPGHGLRLCLSEWVPGAMKKRESKRLRAQTDQLLNLVCQNAREANQNQVIDKALCLAAKEGNAEFVLRVSKEIPQVYLTPTLLSCFEEALKYRQAEVFSLIHGFRFKHGLVTSKIDVGRNTLLHKAAGKAPNHVLNRVYSPLLQMQNELQWFKEVESLTPRTIRGIRNKDNKTAREIFTEEHRELLKEGENWIKATATSYSLIGILIVTIMFTAAYAFREENDQNPGYPLFKVSLFSTISSLLSSSTSVLIFLAVLSSQYSEENFLKAIPSCLLWGLFFLFISILCMIISCLSTIHLVLKHTDYSWGILPIIIPAAIPIGVYARLQFPLAWQTYRSTYGKVFNRRVKKWP
ncbi:uncharacterized protein LOC114721404 [Neltuma alba]|uniref:uncharacterized protein LOC114721404 n=1 Tax=Neltuma alba TaxID=207710 RepID=UPI0010A3F502|nr:uncharacterized protein LOC114721404 [Prosopis alba]